MAGVDGFSVPTWMRHTTLPVLASMRMCPRFRLPWGHIRDQRQHGKVAWRIHISHGEAWTGQLTGLVSSCDSKDGALRGIRRSDGHVL